MSQIVNDSTTSEYVSGQNCNCIFKDGTAALHEHEGRSKAEGSQAALYADFIHCIFHTGALVPCDLHPQLHDVLQEAMKILNLVKSRPMNSCLYAVYRTLRTKKCRQTRYRFYCIRRLGCYKKVNSERFTLVKTSKQAFGVRGGVVGLVTRYRVDGPGFEHR